MGSRLEDQPFKNREHAKAEVRQCALFGNICQYLSFIFAAFGIIGELFNFRWFWLTPTAWFLLAIVVGLNAIIGHMHLVVAKHLLGIETETQKE